MLTTTHALIGAAISTRPRFRPWQITLGWLGGFFPDASVFLMVGMARMSAPGAGGLWRQPDGMYWQQPWQTLSAISNSIPLWAAMCVVGFLLFKKVERLKGLGLGLLIFGSAALAHVLCDFPVHTDDAHVHFWPFSDWRFHSPISYYQRDHFGGEFSIFEMALNLGLVVYLVTHFRQWPVRILAVLLAATPFLMRLIARYIF